MGHLRYNTTGKVRYFHRQTSLRKFQPHKRKATFSKPAIRGQHPRKWHAGTPYIMLEQMGHRHRQGSMESVCTRKL